MSTFINEKEDKLVSLKVIKDNWNKEPKYLYRVMQEVEFLDGVAMVMACQTKDKAFAKDKYKRIVSSGSYAEVQHINTKPKKNRLAIINDYAMSLVLCSMPFMIAFCLFKIFTGV